jgi:hypothetical protein
MAAAQGAAPEMEPVGVGATPELSLRVSVATLCGVIFTHPQERHLMLALERVATLRRRAGEEVVTVKAQPFGGAVRLHGVRALQQRIGGFHFDSERSRSERDFRLQIRPSAWEAVKRFCLEQFRKDNESILESNPNRELVEEFADALNVALTSTQYRLKRMGVHIEDQPSLTDNIHAAGSPTVRIYRLFQVRILDPALVAAVLAHSERYSDQDLRDLALEDVRNGGRGRANGVLALPVGVSREVYRAIPPPKRSAPVTLAGHRLDGNVPVVLETL